MDEDEIARAHIKGQLQGLRAALRQQPNGVHPAAAPSTPAPPTPVVMPAALPTVYAPPPPANPPATRPYQPPPAGTPYQPPPPPMPPASGLQPPQQPPRRAVSPRPGRPSVGAPRAVSPVPHRAVSPGPSRPAAGGGAAGGTPIKAGAKKGNKSDCVAKVEEMQRLRDERRRLAEEKKLKRLEDAKDAEGRGGIESVDFLNKIKVYREAHGIGEAQPWNGGNVWEDEAFTASSIRVCVRKRPMLKIEQQRHDFDVICAEAGHSTLVVMEPKTKVDLTKAIEAHRFTFDAFFNEVDGNDHIYNATLAPLLSHVFGGGHATVFAFGQTGSGKTCTMAGHGNHQATDGNSSGLYKLAAHDLVDHAARRGVSLGVSFFEVYRGQALDLLGERARLEVLEDGKGRIQIVGLCEEAEELRAVGATSANEQSSRSHAILQVVLRDGATGQKMGKLSLVDLAGSERAADASSKDRQTRIEGAEINKSLLCLKECIRSLDSGSSHTPFRGSKLTQVLRDSFVGNSKTVMIATVSPGSSAAENTLNTLRYAQRVKEFSAKRPPAANRRASNAPPGQPMRAAGGCVLDDPRGVASGAAATGGGALGAGPASGASAALGNGGAGCPSTLAPGGPGGAGGPPLPEGWSSAVDPASGKVYFISPKNETTWERPSPPPPPPPPPLPPHQPPPQQPPTQQQPGRGVPSSQARPQPVVEPLATILAPAVPAEEIKLPSAPNSSRVAAAEEAAIDEALGRSLNGRMSSKAAGGADVEEVGQFFKTVAAVSRAEEVLVAQHREAVEADELLIAQEKVMLDDLKDAEGCSVDEYAAALEKVLAAKFRICSELQNRLEALKQMMADEEALSARSS